MSQPQIEIRCYAIGDDEIHFERYGSSICWSHGRVPQIWNMVRVYQMWQGIRTPILERSTTHPPQHTNIF